MSDSAPVLGILFTHGSMAEGMVDAVRRITGVSDALLPMSNEGQGPDALRDEIVRLTRDRPTIVFTDLQAGSCAMSARLGVRDRDDCALICGINLPMLLDFVFHRDMPLPELVDRVVTKGREGMRVLQPPG